MERLCFQRLFRECCLDEIKKISTHAYNESNILISVNKIQDLLQTLIRHKNKVNFSFYYNLASMICNNIICNIYE